MVDSTEYSWLVIVMDNFKQLSKDSMQNFNLVIYQPRFLAQTKFNYNFKFEDMLFVKHKPF